MLIKTLLNRCHKFKSFVYKDVHVSEKNKTTCLEVDIEPRKNSKPICSVCQTPGSTYDTAVKTRRFEFIPIWGFQVFFLYKMRRVNCKKCDGVKVEKVPWADGKSTLTKTFQCYLANWAKALSWKEVASRFQTSYEKVFKSVEYVVKWGLAHQCLEGITAIGVDEIAWKSNHKYLTLVYEIGPNCVRLLWIGKDRTKKKFTEFFDKLGAKRTKSLEFICSDMWKAYLSVIKEKAPEALHILDRFHIVARLNKALDKVRANEHREMKKDGYEPVLTKSRWLLLKKPENLKTQEAEKLDDLLEYNLQTIRAYLLKEEFQLLWKYVSASWAGKFIESWTSKVMRSKIEPLKKEAETIRKHKELILNYFKAKKAMSSGIVEGLNNKAKVTMRKSYGFRTYKCIEIALYHSLGKLPEPPLTHRFY